MRDDVVAVRNRGCLDGRNGLGRKRRRAHAVYHEREVYLPDTQAHEVFRRECGVEYSLQHFRVKRPDTEHDERADVAEDSVAYLFFHLLDVLVGERKCELVFARLGENVGKRFVHHRLKFIDVEIVARELRHSRRRLVGARHRGEVDFDGEHRTQKRGIGLPHAAFGKINDEYFLFIHYFSQVERRGGLPDDVADERIGGELADFVLNGRRRPARVRVGESGEFLGPERFHDRVADFFDDGVAKRFVGEHAVHVEQRRAGILQKRE